MSKIVEIAKSYIGQEEIPGNKGFKDKSFDKKMRKVGFYTGAPWCGFFAMVLYSEAGVSTKLLSASSMRLIEKATKAGNWHTKPIPGAVAVWATFKKGDRQTTGHIAIVGDDINITSVSEKGVPMSGYFETIEGNTNASGGREGNVVAEKQRSFSWDRTDGLRLMGFVYPENA